MSGADTAEHDTALIAAAVNALPGLLALARRALEAEVRPDLDTVRDAFRHGREVGRADAARVCRDFEAQIEQEAREAETAGDLDAAGDMRECAAIAADVREFIARLGPVEEAEEPEEYAAPEPSGWRQIETAPRDGTVILLWGPRYQDAITGEWSKVAPGWVDAGRYALEATHWQPLPPAPKVGP